MTTATDLPLLEFPCEFSIKAMGLASPNFPDLVVALIAHYVPDLEGARVEQRTSSTGKYLSVTVVFQAQDRLQLDNVYRELSGHPQVLMVL